MPVDKYGDRSDKYDKYGERTISTGATKRGPSIPPHATTPADRAAPAGHSTPGTPTPQGQQDRPRKIILKLGKHAMQNGLAGAGGKDAGR